MLRDATYTGITPQFWGSLDAVAGRDSWRLYGLTNCGKGQPGQSAHVSHGAAPARFRERPGRSASRERARGRARRARDAAGGEAEAVAHVERSGLARFAGSEVHQPTLIENAVVTLRVVQGQPRRRRDDEQDRRPTVSPSSRARASDAADSAPPDDQLPGPRAACGSAARRRATTTDTAALGPDDQARLAAAAIDAAGDMPVYGFFTSAVSELAVASSTGLAVEQRMTDATALVVAADEGGSGYAEQTAWRAARDRSGGSRARGRGEGSADEGRRRDRAGRVPRRARAVCARRAARVLRARLVRRARPARGAQLFQRAGSARRIFDEKISIADDALDPRGLPKAFDFEGTPKQRVAARRGRRRPRRRLGPRDGGARRRTARSHDRPRAAGRTHATGARCPSRSPSRPARPSRSTSSRSWSATASTSRACTTSASCTRARE